MNLNIIEPNYFKDFHCIGGECRNNCCHDWSIQLTKREYLTTKNSYKPKELQKICDNALRRLRKSTNSKIYAEMRLKEDGTCQFLDIDGLCMLQKECGYSILSNTCKQFPRKSFLYMNTGEQYLSTGCEEVVRLLMNLPNGIELTDGGQIDHTKFTVPSLFITKPDVISSTPFKYYWDIKTLVISIMKNRNYSVEDRLILLGIAFKHIDDLISANDGDKIPSYIDGLIAACADDKSMLNDIRDIEPKTNQNAINFASMLKTMSDFSTMPKDFNTKIQLSYGITYKQLEDTERIYIEVTNSKIEKQLCFLFNMLSSREYILENFMLNTMLYLNLPFYDNNMSFWDSYIFICQVYSLMIFMLAGNLTETSNDNDIIEAFVVFSRCLFHSKELREKILTFIKEKKSTTLGSMVYLIKF